MGVPLFLETSTFIHIDDSKGSGESWNGPYDSIPSPPFWSHSLGSTPRRGGRTPGQAEPEKDLPPTMPGKWVGGRGSRACPEKDSIFEAEVFQEDGSAQGTILLLVKRLYSPGENGRFILADFITASDEYYRYWVGTPAGMATVEDGSYHLFRAIPRECPAKSKSHETVHLGRWRSFTQEELTKENLPDYPRVALGEIQSFLKKGRPLDKKKGGGEGGLPWGEIHPSPTAGPARPDDGEVVPRRRKKTGGEKEKPTEAEGANKEASKVKLSALQKELAALKKKVSEEEVRAGVAKTKKKKKRATHKEDGKKGSPAFGVGLAKEKKVKSGSPPASSPGGSDDGSSSEEDDSSDEPMESPEGAGSDESRRPAYKRDRGKRDKDDDSRKPSRGREKGKKEVKKKRKKKRKKSHKKGREKKDKSGKKKEKDRGPFGVARTEECTQGGSEDSGESSSSEADFHKASGEKSLQLKLVRYAQRHPGRLATRLLRLMAKAVGFSSGALTQKSPIMKEAPATAHLYFLTVLTPALTNKWTARTAREMKCWATILDLLAEGKGPEAADIASQRLKALERSVHDGNVWRRARYLELVDPEDHLLTDEGEEKMMNREVELEEKTRMKGSWNSWDQDPKGSGKGKKGKEGGKGKGQKGKNPSENAAAKAEKTS